MKPESREVRNPFGVMDVPAPNDEEVLAFAATATLEGGSEDDNATRWSSVGGTHETVEGRWSSRWNGGADPTIPEDSADRWKRGHADVKTIGDRIYFLFRWSNGKREGLIDAQRTGANRLVGKYINLTDPKITRPWVGLIVDSQRIDGRWTSGRLDFRR
jgi:hypothetical protein